MRGDVSSRPGSSTVRSKRGPDVARMRKRRDRRRSKSASRTVLSLWNTNSPASRRTSPGRRLASTSTHARALCVAPDTSGRT